jgi:hypothetical protein
LPAQLLLEQSLYHLRRQRLGADGDTDCCCLLLYLPQDLPGRFILYLLLELWAFLQDAVDGVADFDYLGSASRGVGSRQMAAGSLLEARQRLPV